MKTLYRALVLVFLGVVPYGLTSTAQAENNLPHQEQRQDMPGSGKHFQYDEAKSEEIYQKESAHADKIQEQINLMNAQIKAIQEEKDPAKRETLMKEHNIEMQKAMEMMGSSGAMGMTDQPSKDKRTKHQLGRHTHITKQMSPQRRADLMEQHMDLMQQMMQQMMQRQNLREDIPHQEIRQDMPGSGKHTTH